MGRLLQCSIQRALRHVKGAPQHRPGQNLTAINSALRGLAPLPGPMRQNHAMAERVIPLVDQRIAALAARVPTHPVAPTGQLTDTLGRPLRDLRISVTDRCNFRCSYCMPKEVFDKDYVYLPQSELLSFEEITRIASQFVAHGVEKIRLTGGEPLLRKNLEVLITQLAALRTPQGKPLDLTLTTNGSLLARKAADAGVVYSLAFGDQPALICDLVDWARTCGFPVVAAGRGHKWLPHFSESTPDTVWANYGLTPEQAARGGLNPKMFN
eukprot:gene41796-55447_t